MQEAALAPEQLHPADEFRTRGRSLSVVRVPFDPLGPYCRRSDKPKPGDAETEFPGRIPEGMEAADAESATLDSGSFTQEDDEDVNVHRGIVWRRPRLAFDWGQPDRHRQVSWSELFSDLVVVAAAVQISEAVKKELSWSTLALLAVQFATFWSCWMEYCIFVNRFPVADLVQRGFGFLFIVGLFFVGLFMEDYGHIADVKVGFSVARVACFMSLSLQYLVVMRFVPRFQEMGRRMITSYVLSSALVLVGIWTSDTVSVALWGAAFFMHLFGSGYAWRTKHGRPVPIHIGHMAERHGLFVIIVLGETVLAEVLVERVDDVRFYFCLVLGLALAFGLHILYFDSQPFAASLHAMRRSAGGGRVYAWTHLFLALAGVFIGSALKLLISHFDKPLVPAEVWLLGGNLAMFYASLLIMRMAHRGWRSELGFLRPGDASYELQVAKDTQARKRKIERKLQLARNKKAATAAAATAAEAAESAAAATTAAGDDPEAGGADAEAKPVVGAGVGDAGQEGVELTGVEFPVTATDAAAGGGGVAGSGPMTADEVAITMTTQPDAEDAVEAEEKGLGHEIGGGVPDDDTDPAVDAGDGGLDAGDALPAAAGEGAVASPSGSTAAASKSSKRSLLRFRSIRRRVKHGVRSRVALLQDALTADTTTRRRYLWAGRVVVLAALLLWTGLVARLNEDFTPIGYMAGTTASVALMQVMDYNDILSYSDSAHVHHPH